MDAYGHKDSTSNTDGDAENLIGDVRQPELTHKNEEATNQQYCDKSVVDEVSQILSSMPEAATNFSNATAQWTSISESNCINSGNHDNSSAAATSSSSSNDEDDESEAESSELDEETSSMRRVQCVDEMNLIEKQFFDVRDQLHTVRHSQITKRLTQVAMETDAEYLRQLEVLCQQQEARLQVASRLRNLRIDSLEGALRAEKQANTQHLANEKTILMGAIQADLDEKVRRLEEDRDNVDSELWSDAILDGSEGSNTGDRSTMKGKRSKRKEEIPSLFSFGNIRRKKKAVVVTGPYIVYMLRDADVIDDWTTIKRAVNVSQRRSNVRNLKKRLHTCRYEDGRLVYGGKVFTKGQSVAIKNMVQADTRITGTIVGLSPTEVRVRQSNGGKSKLYVEHLKRGRYTMQHR